ncbi:hypothetical protein [Fuchsiella alkaliacetigena]|nr:hypothetical protein [Fuchsiella alkaliacetigena]
MEQEEVQFAQLNDEEVKKLTKMETTLSNRKGEKIILLAYTEE